MDWDSIQSKFIGKGVVVAGTLGMLAAVPALADESACVPTAAASALQYSDPTTVMQRGPSMTDDKCGLSGTSSQLFMAAGSGSKAVTLFGGAATGTPTPGTQLGFQFGDDQGNGYTSIYIS